MGTRRLVTGEYEIAEIGKGRKDPTMVFSLYRYRNPSEEVQEQYMKARWTHLVCPFCDHEAEAPLFSEESSPISKRKSHRCGSTYYADRSDTRRASEWEKIKGTGSSWQIVHNYHIRLGLVGTELHPDFDVLEADSQLAHVIFISPGMASELDQAPS